MAPKRRNIKSARAKIKQQKMDNNHTAPQQKIEITQEQLDVIVIDITLRELFNNGDKVIIDFHKDVIEKYKIPVNDHGIERMWDILDATQFVNPVVGFGNANKLSLTTQGYNLMLQYGNYQNYLSTMRGAHGQSDNTVDESSDESMTQATPSTPENTEIIETKKKRDDKTF